MSCMKMILEKPPVIILHGGPGSSHYSMQGLKTLAAERTVIFYDQLGCGKSARPADTSLWHIDRFVQELGQVKDAIGLKEFDILGHSWGTTLAAAYYFASPAGVRKIIFSSPCLSAPIWANDQEKNIAKLPIDVRIALKTGEKFGTTSTQEYKNATEVFNKHFVCRLDPKPDFLNKGKQYANPEVYNFMWGPSEFHVKGNLKEIDFTSRLKRIGIPTLFTCGRYDEATPESTEFFSSITPGSKFHVFEESAHMAYVEEPQEYLRIINAFLRQ
ncbi:proline iminopeptidase-family hydrolase [Virgibacillus halophilus]|uniref:Proline iminopeptidase n=1 Tax=Tigheibacillus halophilus TaxID=361280 RepID=A0ABU5C908_9BACI|nr:proline iminopeptidase-family hydrolase [Virgibacillus halophilus]